MLKFTKEVSGGADLKAQVHEMPVFPLHHLVSLTISEVVRIDTQDCLLYGGICALLNVVCDCILV